MRILFTASGLPSHFFVLPPLAWAARAAGHEVQIAVPPAMCPAAASSGLPVLPAGRPMDFNAEYRKGPAAGNPASGQADPKQLFAQIAEDMSGELVSFARQWQPDLVVWEPTCFAGPVTAAAVGVPSVRQLWGPDIVGRGTSSRERMPARVGELIEQYGANLDDLAEWRTLDPCPPALQVPHSAPWQHVRYVPFSTAAQVAPAMLARPTRPRIVVTLGMTLADLVGARGMLAPGVVRALTGTGAEIVVAMPSSQAAAFAAAGPWPDEVKVVQDCPLTVLLEDATAVVHHGGAGTLLSAAQAGVPQLITSVLPDGLFYGKLLASSGAGLRLNAAEASSDDIATAVGRLCAEPEFARAAFGLQEDALGRPSPAQVIATHLPTLARGPVLKPGPVHHADLCHLPVQAYQGTPHRPHQGLVNHGPANHGTPSRRSASHRPALAGQPAA
jgi:UDP:flavonoid glycosyltransferase YjiC (YdhE family)